MTPGSATPGSLVYARWGALKTLYAAQVEGAYVGGVARVELSKFEGGWERWVKLEEIVKVVRGGERGGEEEDAGNE